MKSVARMHLIEERKRRQWSQQNLADIIGTTQRTVSRWESGSMIPGPYFRAKLCEVFSKQPQELGLLDCAADEEQQTDHPPTLAPSNGSGAAAERRLPPWHLPFPRNAFFTGRAELLQLLHEQLCREHTMALTQSWAISGLGGIGKTQIALEYAYRYWQHYTAILWISAETSETLLAGFVALAEALDLPERHEQDQRKVVQAVKRWLSEQNNWLLIFDNAEDLTLLSAFLPHERQGSLLLTTRLQALGTFARQVAVEPMSMEEGVAFLTQRAKLLPPGALPTQLAAADLHAARGIVAAMDGLPLALDQAGAYIEEVRCELEDYLNWYRQQRLRFLERRGRSNQDHPIPVGTTLALSFRQVQERNPAAMDILRACAFLAPDAIPEEVFTEGCTEDNGHLSMLAADPWLWNEALAVLGSYSLLRRDAHTKTLNLHRLVQAVLQESLVEREQEAWLKCVIIALNRIFPEVQIVDMEPGTWSQCERVLPHALQCAKHAGPCEQANTELATLLFNAGIYLTARAQYQEAETVLRQGLQIREQVLGSEHPDVASVLNACGTLSHLQGKNMQAQQWYQRALHIQEHCFGAEHPDVARSLNNLGIAYLEQGMYTEAEPILKRALHILEQTLGTEDVRRAYPLENLGHLYHLQGRYTEAESVIQRSLHLRERFLGIEHPLVAYPLVSLSTLYCEQEKYAEAELMARRALHIREQELGGEHPLVAYPLDTLGVLYCEQGKYAEAELLLKRALHIREQARGGEDMDVAKTLDNLAKLFSYQGFYEEAQALYERALGIKERQLAPNHLLIGETLYGLASLYALQGRYTDSNPLYQRALAISEQFLGLEHQRMIEMRRQYLALLTSYEAKEGSQ